MSVLALLLVVWTVAIPLGILACAGRGSRRRERAELFVPDLLAGVPRVRARGTLPARRGNTGCESRTRRVVRDR